ncbi:MAG: c-type cytochrome, partial [Acidobacteriota bacterium]
MRTQPEPLASRTRRTLCRWRSGVLLAVAALAALALRVGGEALPASPAAEEVYQNIQVLRGTPSDQLVPSMEFITEALGVRCGHCHVGRDFANDEKPAKEKARKMMRLTAKMNRDRLATSDRVTCYTCHRGGLAPGLEPQVETVLEPNFQEIEGAAPSAEQIFERHARAIKGSDARPLGARISRGTLQAAFGRGLPLEISEQPPGRYARALRLQGGENLSVFDGVRGTVVAPGREPRPMREDEALIALLPDPTLWTDRAEATFQSPKVRGRATLNGVETDVVQVEKGGSTVELYFERQEGLLRRARIWAETPVGRLST